MTYKKITCKYCQKEAKVGLNVDHDSCLLARFNNFDNLELSDGSSPWELKW
ncbi:MAG: hypothetical protein GBAus27B_000153 [Mycoplasmataceae bacterium]|nr:MAG: hypothetical protein GBAus27B_000153 [Mycoplasmataceae bacterium]